MSTAKNKAAAQPSSRRKDALSPLAECEAESHEKRSVKNGKCNHSWLRWQNGSRCSRISEKRTGLSGCGRHRPHHPCVGFPCIPQLRSLRCCRGCHHRLLHSKGSSCPSGIFQGKKNPCCALHHSIIRGNHRADAGNKQGGCDSEIREYVCWRKSVAGFGAACGSHSGRKRLRYRNRGKTSQSED